MPASAREQPTAAALRALLFREQPRLPGQPYMPSTLTSEWCSPTTGLQSPGSAFYVSRKKLLRCTAHPAKLLLWRCSVWLRHGRRLSARPSAMHICRSCTCCADAQVQAQRSTSALPKTHLRLRLACTCRTCRQHACAMCCCAGPG